MAALGPAQRAISLHLLFSLDTRENCMETVAPAEPTLEIAVLLDLVQLRLHAERLPAGVREIELRVENVKATRAQLELFASLAKRSGTWIDTDARIRPFEQPIHVDNFFLRNSRLFGLAVVLSVMVLAFTKSSSVCF